MRISAVSFLDTNSSRGILLAPPAGAQPSRVPASPTLGGPGMLGGPTRDRGNVAWLGTLNREHRMWKWTRKPVALLLAFVVLAAGVACTSEESLGPSAAQPSESLTGIVSELSNLHLLSCSPQPYAMSTEVIGAEGGTITVGTQRLVIPAGALSAPVTITAEQVTGNVNSVRFSPEGLQFAKPAALTLSYSNCSPLMLVKKVVYADETLRILDLIPSLDNLLSETVTGTIKHFSRYAVAW